MQSSNWRRSHSSNFARLNDQLSHDAEHIKQTIIGHILWLAWAWASALEKEKSYISIFFFSTNTTLLYCVGGCSQPPAAQQNLEQSLLLDY